jgi:hypothetical protein
MVKRDGYRPSGGIGAPSNPPSRRGGGKKKDTIEVPRYVLEWWLRLVHLNPNDLEPRMKEYLNK